MKRGHYFSADVTALRERISPRDRAVLDQIADLRLMSGAQIEAVHFPLGDHETASGAGRACRRVLHRLVRLGLLARLERRVGGTRGGSVGFIYGVTELGQRVLRDDGKRRRFSEPTATFVHHTLAVSQIVVDLIEQHHAKKVEILRLETEPRCWRRFSTGVSTEVLRPDLFVALGVDDYEHHWFVEMDLGTETIDRRIAKCKQYGAYFRAGIEQANHGIFPRVIWVMPRQPVAETLHDRIGRSRTLTADMFEVVTADHALDLMAGGRL